MVIERLWKGRGSRYMYGGREVMEGEGIQVWGRGSRYGGREVMEGEGIQVHVWW